MASPAHPVPSGGNNAVVEALLGQVCEALQITPQQHAWAVAEYNAVQQWLAAPESPLRSMMPQLYPQGSMALGTTTRPWTDDEKYDLDIVLQLEAKLHLPMVLYGMVEARLKAHSRYGKILERKRRCLTLNFKEGNGVFHMDILPARPDAVRKDTCIEVPDRKDPHNWQPSNPRGYVAWFEGRSVFHLEAMRRASKTPIPDEVPARMKAVIKKVVQLVKRRRDIAFSGRPEFGPRSIVLTTLVGHAYDGGSSVVQSLGVILNALEAAVVAAAPRRIQVVNPTNPDEKFCESFKTDAHYQQFVAFIRSFAAEVRSLQQGHPLPELQRLLSAMFGETTAKRALDGYAKAISKTRGDSSLKASSGAATVGLVGLNSRVESDRSRAVPRNTHFGD